MRFTANEVAAATGGAVVGSAAVCHGASIDSRSVVTGQLFVPIVDARDGHDFIDAALAAGAAMYLTDRAPQGGTAIVVDDTATALTALGRAARARHEGPVIAITGSVGKTSVKDLTLAALSGSLRAHASERSFNNELGVPLTLINSPDDTQVLIVEMGARGIGHIAELCAIASPTIGIVTWVGAVHTSEFGSIESVAVAKGELVEALPADGFAILNIDCAPVAAMSDRTRATVITYGDGGDISARDISIDADLRPSFVVDSVAGSTPVSLSVHGVHHVANALAACAAAHAVAVPLGAAADGLAMAALSPWRMELGRTTQGATIINDAYNANAISTAAALRSLAALDANRRIAVLGVMAELGDRHDQDHRDIAVLCAALDIDLIAYQEDAYGVASVADFDAALNQIGDLSSDDAVLVKASRVAELEGLAALLLAS